MFILYFDTQKVKKGGLEPQLLRTPAYVCPS